MPKFILTRHANPRLGPDMFRQLSEDGQRQAAAAHQALGGKTFVPNLVVVSPTLRTVETAERVTNILRSEGNFILLPELHWGYDPAFDGALTVMHKRFGYAPIRSYMRHRRSGSLTDYGQHVWGQLADLAEERGADIVSVVGHATLLQTIGLAAMKGGNAPEQHIDALLDLVLGEADSFVIDFDVEFRSTGFETIQS